VTNTIEKDGSTTQWRYVVSGDEKGKNSKRGGKGCGKPFQITFTRKNEDGRVGNSN